MLTCMKDKNIFKCKRELVTHYWKKVRWQQPVLSSDTPTAEMTVTASSSQDNPYKAFNKINNSAWISANQTTTAYLYVQFTTPKTISSITVKGYGNRWGYTKSITIYKDLNHAEVIGAQKTYDGNTTETWTFDTPIETSTLAFKGTGSGWTAIDEIEIEAYITVPGTPDDYTYTTQDYQYFAFRKG